MASLKDKRSELLDDLLKDYDGDPKAILGEGGLLKDLTKSLVERALEGEMTAHVGYAPHADEGRGSGNSRNGTSGKTLQSEAGQFEVAVPRDRNGTFEPQLVRKRQRRLQGLETSPMRCSRRCVPGRRGRYRRCTRSCISMRCSSNRARTAQ